MWVKLSDDWYDNRKFQQVTPLAELLYLRCLAWSCRNLSDGFVPAETVRRLTPTESDRADPDLEAPRLARSLVAVELWHPAEDGYAIHDFLEFNKPRSEILEQRRRDLDRKRNHTARNP